uniref:Si:ch211-214c7.5 n=1 Tax=Sphaeramia orbicularis TaxID=375764 RepID=A0A673CUN5_9TELE
MKKHSILQVLMRKADDLQSHFDKESLTAALQSFLYTCQPYFIHLESSARSTVHYMKEICLFNNGKAVVSSVLTVSSYHSTSVSHFYIGQFCLGQIRVTTFRYCKPTPYLARVNTGLYKRMRWNIKHFLSGITSVLTVALMGFSFFLCYEDVLVRHAESDRNIQGVPQSNMVRMWSIGKWVQVDPNPDTEDIYEWILCEVPKANYQTLLLLGTDEPSCCTATDFLQQLLLSDSRVI